MTKKNKVEKTLSHLISAHVHSDKSSEVLQKKKDLDKNVEKILSLIRHSDDDGDDHYSDNQADKSELSSLVKEFHKGYESLHDHYTQLYEALKEGVHRGGEKQNHAFHDGGSASSDSTDSDSEVTRSAVKKLKVQVENAEERTERLEKTIEYYASVKEKMEFDMSNQASNIQELTAIIDEKNRLVDSLTRQLNGTVRAEEQFATLSEENENLKLVLADVQSGKADVVQKLAAAQEEIKRLEKDIEGLRIAVEVAESETKYTLTRNAQLESEKLELESVLGVKREEIELLQQAKLDLENDNSLLVWKLQEARSSVEDGLNSIIKRYNEFEELVDGRIVDHGGRLDGLRQECILLLESCRKLKSMYEKSASELTRSKNVEWDHSEMIKSLESERIQFAEKIQQLDLENGRLLNCQKELEAQLQLTKQKLRVTEAEMKDKERMHEAEILKANTRVQDIENIQRQLCDRLCGLEALLRRTEEKAKSETTALGNRFSELKSSLDERYAHFLSKLSECADKVEMLHARLAEHVEENRELRKEKSDLAGRLEEKEAILLALTASVADSEQKVAGMEGRIRETEEEIAARDQAKISAINQLCLAIEYYWEANSRLREMICKRSAPARHIS